LDSGSNKKTLETYTFFKSQATLITKFLKIAKKCYDWSNFSSAFSIYDGLQEVTVRNLRAWQQVPNKTFQILEKIATVKVIIHRSRIFKNFLKHFNSF